VPFDFDGRRICRVAGKRSIGPCIALKDALQLDAIRAGQEQHRMRTQADRATLVCSVCTGRYYDLNAIRGARRLDARMADNREIDFEAKAA
jgi:hypothetical protein